MSEWRLIKTAKKDGTEILGYRRGWIQAISVIFWNRQFRMDEWVTVPGIWPFRAYPLDAPTKAASR